MQQLTPNHRDNKETLKILVPQLQFPGIQPKFYIDNRYSELFCKQPSIKYLFSTDNTQV